MVAHHSSGGCDLRPGDLFGTGTISGSTPGSEGSLLEITRGRAQAGDPGRRSERRFLEDGDEVSADGAVRRRRLRPLHRAGGAGMSGRLAGQTALITGAGSGIGRATAWLFAAEGARLLIADRMRRALDDHGRPGGAGRDGSPTVVADAGSEDDVAAFVARAIG